jgi:predicted dehydrogenase
MNRRSFLRTGVGAAAALAAVRAGGAPAEVRCEPVRIGVIGTGGRGTSLLQTILLFPRVEVPAVCDLVPERTQGASSLVEKTTGRRPEVYSGSELAWEGLVERDDLDAVLIATPWEWHARMAVAAMRTGKHPGVEVPAAITVEECWDLVRTSEATGIPCTMLENVCYFENVLALLRMVREGHFGEVQHCEAGYQHDCRSHMFDDRGELTWRGRHAAERDGNLYPTHPLGPVAQWMDINRGDRFLSLSSVSTPAKALQHYAAKRFGPEHPAARRTYALGDVNTTLLKAASGRTVTLYLNLMTYRPYDLILRLEGVRGIYLGTNDSICLESDDPSRHEWVPFAPYREKFEHPLWKALRGSAMKSGGHGGAEYLMFHDFLEAVRTKSPAPQDVYDAAAWSAVFPLSIESVARGGAPVEFPDFTGGQWKARPPLPIHGA